MDTLITKKDTTQYATSMEVSCGKKTAFVSFNNCGWVTVCCYNAAHRVWRGAGKTFRSIEEAFDGYKTGEMKAILWAAKAEMARE